MDRLRRRRRPQTPGAGGDSFQRPGQIPGGSGQFTLFDTPFSYIEDPRDLANLDGLGGVFGVPTFLWVAGDGNTPTIGPALTATGTPAARVSPWQLQDGTDVANEFYDGSSYRTTATVVDPTLGQDVVIYALKKMPYVSTGTNAIITNRVGGRGWLVYSRFAQHGVFVRDFIDPSIAVLANAAYSSWSVIIIIIDYGANTHLVVNGVGAGTAATPSSAVLGQGTGLGLSSAPDGSSFMENGGETVFAGFQYGNGIADAWIADTYAMALDFTCRFSGLCPVVGDMSTFTRNSVASWEDRNGVWRISSNNFARAGDSGGFIVAPGVINKMFNNINPQSVSGYGSTGGTRSIVNDSVQLATDNLSDFGPSVHRFVPGGADQVIFNGAQTGNTNTHSISVYMRGTVGGESVDLGVRDQSTGVVTNLGTQVLTTSWVRYTVDGFTPGDVDERWCLDCDAGDTILFIMNQLEEGAVSTSPIPSYATAATATRAADILQTQQPLPDIQGSVGVKITPLGWSGGDGGDSELIERTGAAALLLYPASGGTYQSDDSASTVTGTYAPVDGVETQNRVRWATSGELSLSDDSGRVSTAYSGALKSTGDLKVEASAKEAAVRDLRVYRNGDG